MTTDAAPGNVRLNDGLGSVLPCPFCGRQPDLDNPDTLYPSGIAWVMRGRFKVYVNFREAPPEQWCYEMNCCECCGGCGAEMHGDSKADVVRKWNRRPNVRGNARLTAAQEVEDGRE